MPDYFVRSLIPLAVAFVIAPIIAGQSSDRLNQMQKINPALPQPIEIDIERVQANSIQIENSKHLTLFTDIRNRKDIDELNTVFDAAVSEWCRYFSIDMAKTKAWHLRGLVIADRKRFVQAGLMPRDLPDFPAGFQRGHEMWVYLQRGKYYTRHLLLHEGTHSFMQWFLGGTGAPWYTEGMAELLAVHSWRDGKLKMNFRLTDRSQAEYWGRIKIIQQDCRDGKAMKLDEVFDIPSAAFREVRYYAWSWAACEFLSNHPNSKVAFAELQTIADKGPNQFNQQFADRIKDVRTDLERDWQLFVNEIEFGYSVARGRLQTIQSEGEYEFLLDSTSSWQVTPIQVQVGDRMKISSSGRFVVADDNGTPWPCESGGITIEYYNGRPLGRLMVGVLGSNNDVSGLLSPIDVPVDGAIQFERNGVVSFRINESPADLLDNQGQLKLTVELEK